MPNSNFIIDPGSIIKHKVHTGRLTWSYLLKRCLAEGISKARLTRVAGWTASLSEERSYVSSLLVKGVNRDLSDAFRRGDFWGLARVVTIFASLGSAAIGYAVGLFLPFPRATVMAQAGSSLSVVTRDQPSQ